MKNRSNEDEEEGLVSLYLVEEISEAEVKRVGKQ
jgi:hypothetical protein